LNGISHKYSGGLYPTQIQDKSLYSEKAYLVYYPKDFFPGFLEQYSILAFQNTVYDTSLLKSGIAIGIIYDYGWEVQVSFTDSNGIKLESGNIQTAYPAIDTSIQIGNLVQDTLNYNFGFNTHDTISAISFSVRRIH
jgi:hypothetical protein